MYEPLTGVEYDEWGDEITENNKKMSKDHTAPEEYFDDLWDLFLEEYTYEVKNNITDKE